MAVQAPDATDDLGGGMRGVRWSRRLVVTTFVGALLFTVVGVGMPLETLLTDEGRGRSAGTVLLLGGIFVLLAVLVALLGVALHRRHVCVIDDDGLAIEAFLFAPYRRYPFAEISEMAPVGGSWLALKIPGGAIDAKGRRRNRSARLGVGYWRGGREAAAYIFGLWQVSGGYRPGAGDAAPRDPHLK